MKKCQFCAEEILDEASVCKHCGQNQAAPTPKGTGKGLIFLAAGGLLIVAGHVIGTGSAEGLPGWVLFAGFLATWIGVVREVRGSVVVRYAGGLVFALAAVVIIGKLLGVVR